jgi:hypothetical protein
MRDEIEATAWKAFTYRGQVWGYPLSIEAIGLIYNKALVPTPPATFDELIASTSSWPQGKKAILWDFNKSFFTWPMLAGPGGFVFGRTPRVTTTRGRWASTPPARCKAPDAGAPGATKATCPRARATPRWKPASHAARWR